MRWTAEQDQRLLVSILLVHSISVDGNAVAALMANGDGERPTARAITERVFKIRKTSGIGLSSGTAIPVAPVTKAKKRTGGAARTNENKVTKTKKSARKRKASTVFETTEESDGEDQEEALSDNDDYTPPNKKRRSARKIKLEEEDEDDEDLTLPISPAMTTSPTDSTGHTNTYYSATYGENSGTHMGGSVYDTLDEDLNQGGPVYGAGQVDGSGSVYGYAASNQLNPSFPVYPYNGFGGHGFGGSMSSSLG